MAGSLHTTTVQSARSIAPHVREMVLAGTEPPLSWRAGQWIPLHLPVGERPPLIRAYSLAEPPPPDGRMTLVFDAVPEGLGSSYLFGLQRGDEVTFGEPIGHFVLPEPPPEELLFVAHFTGIVPLRCMLHKLDAGGHVPPITLLYGAMERDDLIYHEEFRARAARDPSFRYIPVLHEAPAGWEGETELEPDVLRRVVTTRGTFVPYVCGLKGFVRACRAYLQELGFDRKEVRVETYD
jgi:NAD(P)H-flavin reductase